MMNRLGGLTDAVLEASVIGSFSRIGFAVRSALLPEFKTPLPSMAGRTVLITGATAIAFHALHPGWVRTPGLSRALPTFGRLMRPLSRTPEQGADSVIWLAAADRRQLGSGRFWHDRRPRAAYRRPGPPPDPPGTGQALWAWAVELAARSAAER